MKNPKNRQQARVSGVRRPKGVEDVSWIIRRMIKLGFIDIMDSEQIKAAEIMLRSSVGRQRFLKQGKKNEMEVADVLRRKEKQWMADVNRIREKRYGKR